MDKEILILNSKIVELNSLSSNTKEIIMHVHTIDEENFNGLTFTLSSTEQYMNTLVNKPVVVKMNTTESDFKGHEAIFDEYGQIIKLDTIPIGTITEVWIEDRTIDGETKKALMAKATIWSYKFPTAVEIMQTLFTAGNLDTSVEVAIFSYLEESTLEHRKTDSIEYLANTLLGSMILPADSNAGVIEMFYKEVAQALSQTGSDLSINNKPLGGAVVLLSHEEIKTQLRALLNPNDNEAGHWQTDYYMYDGYTYDDYCIVTSASDGKYYRFDYEIQNETTVALVGEPREQIREFRDVVANEVAEADEMYLKFKEQVDKINELSSTLTQKETEIAELTEQKKTELETLQNEIAELQKVKNETEVKDEAIIKLNSAIDDLKNQIASLEPIKEEHERIQAEIAEKVRLEKVENLKQFALNSKMITEKEIAEDETIKQMVEELNEVAVKSLIADRIVEKASLETTPPSNPDVVISTADPKDLLEGTILNKYGFSN